MHCICGPQGLPRGLQDEPNLGSRWLPEHFKNHLRSISSLTDAVVASKGRSTSQFEAVSGTTLRLPGPAGGAAGSGGGGGGGGGGAGRSNRTPKNGPFPETSSKTAVVQTVTYNPRQQTSHVLASRDRESANERRYIEGDLFICIYIYMYVYIYIPRGSMCWKNACHGHGTQNACHGSRHAKSVPWIFHVFT